MLLAFCVSPCINVCVCAGCWYYHPSQLWFKCMQWGKSRRADMCSHSDLDSQTWGVHSLTNSHTAHISFSPSCPHCNHTHVWRREKKEKALSLSLYTFLQEEILFILSSKAWGVSGTPRQISLSLIINSVLFSLFPLPLFNHSCFFSFFTEINSVGQQ